MGYQPTKEDFARWEKEAQILDKQREINAEHGKYENGQWKPTPELNARLMREIESGERQGEGFLDTAGRYADKFNKFIESTRIPAFAGGLLQGGIRGVESLANIPLWAASKVTGKDLTLPYVDFQKYLPDDSKTRAAFMGGEIGGELIPGNGS